MSALYDRPDPDSPWPGERVWAFASHRNPRGAPGTLQHYEARENGARLAWVRFDSAPDRLVAVAPSSLHRLAPQDDPLVRQPSSSRVRKVARAETDLAGDSVLTVVGLNLLWRAEVSQEALARREHRIEHDLPRVVDGAAVRAVLGSNALAHRLARRAAYTVYNDRLDYWGEDE